MNSGAVYNLPAASFLYGTSNPGCVNAGIVKYGSLEMQRMMKSPAPHQQDGGYKTFLMTKRVDNWIPELSLRDG